MTRQMLMYRAASFWTNAYAPELSMGMRTVEEYQDIIDVDYQNVETEVAAEKQDNANKVQIGVDLGDGKPITEIDKETGEVRQVAYAPNESAPKSPAPAQGQSPAPAAHPGF